MPRDGRQRTVCHPRVCAPLHRPRRLRDLLERAARRLRLDLDAGSRGQEEAEVDEVAVAVAVRTDCGEKRPVAEERMVGGDREIPRLGHSRPRRGNRVRVGRRPLDRRREDEQRQDQDTPAKSAHPTQLMRRSGAWSSGGRAGATSAARPPRRRPAAGSSPRQGRRSAAARHAPRLARATASRGRAAPRKGRS